MALVLNANALINLDSFKRYVKVPTIVISEDEILRDVINEASALCESYCNRLFRAQTFTEVHNGGRTPALLTGQWPINTVTSVNIDSSRQFAAGTIVDPNTYTLGLNEKGEAYTVELFDEVFPQGRKNVQVIYQFGYVLDTDVPADLQLACKRTGAYYWKLQQSESFMEVQKTKGNENLTILDGIPQSAALILDNYTRLEMLAPPDSVRNS